MSIEASIAREDRAGNEARDLDHCRALLRDGSKSFAAAARLLPRHARDAATAVYAFCRVADDAVDATEHADDPLVLSKLRARLRGVYAGQPRDAVDRALARVVRTYALPEALLDALLEGFAWDREGRRYHTIDELYAYAARVAGAVGAIMAVLMGRTAAGVVARACDLGVAMQLTNIARDVGDDARAGRLYLPAAWLEAEGVSPASFLANPQPSPALARVVDQLLRDADRLYSRAETGIAALPASCRASIWAARFIYADIGRALRVRHLDSVTGRATVSTARKLLLLGHALWRAATGSFRAPAPELLDEPPLPETRFLVEAATASAS